MKRTILALLMMVAVATTAWATPVTFTPDVAHSTVTFTDNVLLNSITGDITLNNTPFTLGDNQTQTLNFFNIGATGLWYNSNSSYTVQATLAFLSPQIQSQGTGSGAFSSIFGTLTGGNLTWSPATLPDVITLANGNTVKIDFQNISDFKYDTNVLAFVTNQGGASSVPEPGTMALLGAGFLGLAIYTKRRKNA